MSAFERASAYGSCTFKPVVREASLWPIGCPEVAGTDSSPLHQIAAALGGRPDLTQARPPWSASDFRLFGDLKGVIDLDTEVSHGRLKSMDFST